MLNTELSAPEDGENVAVPVAAEAAPALIIVIVAAAVAVATAVAARRAILLPNKVLLLTAYLIPDVDGRSAATTGR
jgi:hypothetical protein